MELKYAQEGTFATFFTLKGWFVKVKQAFDIEKVKFSFVEKGKHGSGFDIYVKFDDFDLLCDDILSKDFAIKLANDNGPYPGAWKYVSGKDGNNELSIGKGKSQPVVIQGRNKKQKLNAFVGVGSYDELRKMAVWFKRISKNYIENISNICCNAKVYKESNVEENDMGSTVIDSNITLYTNGSAFQQNDFIVIPVIDENKTSLLLCMDQSGIMKFGTNWNTFLTTIATKPLALNIVAEKRENAYLFKDFQKGVQG